MSVIPNPRCTTSKPPDDHHVEFVPAPPIPRAVQLTSSSSWTSSYPVVRPHAKSREGSILHRSCESRSLIMRLRGRGWARSGVGRRAKLYCDNNCLGPGSLSFKSRARAPSTGSSTSEARKNGLARETRRHAAWRRTSGWMQPSPTRQSDVATRSPIGCAQHSPPVWATLVKHPARELPARRRHETHRSLLPQHQRVGDGRHGPEQAESPLDAGSKPAGIHQLPSQLNVPGHVRVVGLDPNEVGLGSGPL